MLRLKILEEYAKGRKYWGKRSIISGKARKKYVANVNKSAICETKNVLFVVILFLSTNNKKFLVIIVEPKTQ